MAKNCSEEPENTRFSSDKTLSLSFSPLDSQYYADMDIEPLQPMDGLVALVRNPSCVVGLEPTEHAVLAYS